MRSLPELRDVPDPAWPMLQDMIGASPRAQLVPAARDEGEACLLALQVTAESFLGALALHAGALLVDHGWLRILGAGTAEVPSLSVANDLTRVAPPSIMLVAFDVVGGRFAIDGGGLGLEPGRIAYWAPDALSWVPLGLGHTDFVSWALTGGTADFYADLRWDGWEAEVTELRGDQGLSIWPPLFVSESRPASAASRRAVPWTELSGFLDDAAAQAGP